MMYVSGVWSTISGTFGTALTARSTSPRPTWKATVKVDAKGDRGI
jgi:hypothetical protein